MTNNFLRVGKLISPRLYAKVYQKQLQLEKTTHWSSSAFGGETMKQIFFTGYFGLSIIKKHNVPFLSSKGPALAFDFSICIYR